MHVSYKLCIKCKEDLPSHQTETFILNVVFPFFITDSFQSSFIFIGMALYFYWESDIDPKGYTTALRQFLPLLLIYTTAKGISLFPKGTKVIGIFKEEQIFSLASFAIMKLALCPIIWIDNFGQ